MKKTILLLVVVIGFGITAIAQKKPLKIAVFDFNAGAGIDRRDADGIAAIFSTFFIDPQKFILVERTQINKVIAEQGFQYSMLTNLQMVKVGKILNAQKMVVGNINVVSGQYNIDVRLINVQTGAVEATEGTTWTEESSYREMIQDLAQKLMAKIALPITERDCITLLGYLKVYPEDLGLFSDYPENMINEINRNNAYGINTWRLPTNDEFNVLVNHASKIKLKCDPPAPFTPVNYSFWINDPYPVINAKKTKKAHIRLVSTD